MIALVLRPEPGASATCRRAAGFGLPPVCAPLFRLRPLGWGLPAGAFDAVMVTSANAMLLGGPRLATLSALPVYAVGAATAEAVRAAGFTQIHVGSGDAAALAAAAAAGGMRRLIHLCGRERRTVTHPELEIVPVAVYAADAADTLPAEVHAALDDGAVALLHSPRAASLFARLIDAAGIARGTVRLAAISVAALAAAGSGWADSVAAALPTDAALLAAASAMGE